MALAIRDEKQYLATVHEVRELAERCETVGDAKALADQARAMQVWAERARLGQEKVNLAAAAKLWAERRAGELLAETDLAKNQHDAGNTTLPALGVTKMQSSRWQKLAEIPADEFAHVTEDAIEGGRIPLKEVQRRADRAHRETAKAEQTAKLVEEVKRSGLSATVAVSDLRDFSRSRGSRSALLTVRSSCPADRLGVPFDCLPRHLLPPPSASRTTLFAPPAGWRAARRSRTPG